MSRLGELQELLGPDLKEVATIIDKKCKTKADVLTAHKRSPDSDVYLRSFGAALARLS